MKIVKASIGDVDLISEYRVQLWSQAGKVSSDEEYKSLIFKNREYFLKHFREEKIVVPIIFDKDKKNILSIGIGVIIQKPIVNWENPGQEGYIFNMHTKEEYRGRGFATGILREIYSFFKEKGVYKLSLTSNENSFNLYRANGMLNNKFYQEINLRD